MSDRREPLTPDGEPTAQSGGTLHRLDMLRCPDCKEIVARKDVAEEDYGSGLVMWCCPKCDCESEPDVWESSSQHIALLDCEDPDAPLDEKEAIAAGLAIVAHYQPTGESDFDKGMRILQAALRKPKAKQSNGRRELPPPEQPGRKI